MGHPFKDASTPLNRTYDLEATSMLPETPRITASTPEIFDQDCLESSPIKRAEPLSPVDINVDFCTQFTPRLISSPDPDKLKQSLESHYRTPKGRDSNILAAPRSIHRSQIKDKTPKGSEERCRLLQALRSAQLERDEAMTEYLVCSPSINSGTQTRKVTRLQARANLFGTPNHTPSCASTKPPAASFTSVIRTKKYGGIARSFAPETAPAPKMLRSQLRAPPTATTPPNLCVESATPFRAASKSVRSTAKSNNLQFVDGLQTAVRCSPRLTPKQTPFSQPPSTFHSVIRTNKYGGRRDRTPSVANSSVKQPKFAAMQATPITCPTRSSRNASTRKKVAFVD